MGRQLPFDVFVTRKIAKWTAHSTLTSTSFISSIGTSPLEEMIFFWNGYKKQSPTDLSASLSNLSYTPPSTTPNPQSTSPQSSPTTTPDEQAINSVLRAVIHRNLRQHTSSISLLRPILCLEPATLRGDNKDDWPIPVAHYEMAVNLWMQRKGYNQIYGDGIVSNSSASQNMSLEKDGVKSLSEEDLTHDAKLVSEAKKHIETAKGWGSYSLDARVGMKITAAAGAIKSWEGRFGGN